MISAGGGMMSPGDKPGISWGWFFMAPGDLYVELFVYLVVNGTVSIRVYLHYHDYILDGRWVVTENIDSDDKSAVVRNKGDGWDDEECPEKETYQWELRSKRSGYFFANQVL